MECPNCLGTGWFEKGDPDEGIVDTCLECNGYGQVEEEE